VSPAAMLVLGIVVLGVLNLSARLPVEVAALAVLLALVVAGVVPVGRALTGFGNDAVWLVVGMMIVAEGLRRSGIMARVADGLTRAAGGSSGRLRLGVVLLGALAGGLLESTAAVVGTLPVVSTAARRLGHPPGGFYVALALGAMAGGLTTLIGTSGNVVANAALINLGQPSLSFFALLPLGVAFFVVAAVYVLAMGRRLDVVSGGTARNLKEYTGEVIVPETSQLVGQRLVDIAVFRRVGVTVLAIFRKGQRPFIPGPDDLVEAGDRLLVVAPAPEHVRWPEIGGLRPGTQDEAAELTESVAMGAAEVMVPPGSPWVGRTPVRLRLRQQGVLLLALWRSGEAVRRRVAITTLRAGDLLLVQAEAAVLDRLERDQTVVRVVSDEPVVVPSSQPLRAVVPLALFLVLAILGVANLGVDALGAATVALMLGVLSPSDAYAAVEWRVPLLLGAVLPLAAAVSYTGLAKDLSRIIVSLTVHQPLATVVAVYLLAALLTQILSNIAVAALLTPPVVAIGAALHFGVTGIDGLVATMLAALMMTPMSGTANKPALLVMARGSFRHRDYLRMGLIPSVAGAVAAMAVVMTVWHP
jgi:di/tricarboxylate transporter